MIKTILASNIKEWKKSLEIFEKVDACQLPELHTTYSQLHCGSGSTPQMWVYADEKNQFNYPFIINPVSIKKPNGNSIETEYFDIESVYGYSGPLATTTDRSFLDTAWKEFDKWALNNKIICEFIRFSTFCENTIYAHNKIEVIPNRLCSIAKITSNEDEYLLSLKSKTRNMIRRARKEGLEAKEVPISQYISEFRDLYDETMKRNSASSFFDYDDSYYENLLKFPSDEICLHAVFKDKKMVSAAIGLINKNNAFYHLGASLADASKVGAGNLVLFDMAINLGKKGINFFNVGGGRTSAENDPLFKFKKSNGNDVTQYYIGKRVIDTHGYNYIASQWKIFYNSSICNERLQFYR
jgi:hypothetical protein